MIYYFLLTASRELGGVEKVLRKILKMLKFKQHILNLELWCSEILPAPISFYNFTEIWSSCTHMQKHGQLSGVCQFKLLLKIPKFATT